MQHICIINIVHYIQGTKQINRDKTSILNSLKAINNAIIQNSLAILQQVKKDLKKHLKLKNYRIESFN